MIAIVLGTRPEIIKLSHFIEICKKRFSECIVIHTNQHYSEELDKIFFDELQLPLPDINLNVGSGTHAYQTGQIMMKLEKELIENKVSLVVVQGDTNSALAGALTSAKLNIPIAHIEAGLRSYDKKMPEEINRIIIDHLSTYCFAPTKIQKKILLKEGIPKNTIFVTGNTIVDAVFRNINYTKKDILRKYNLEPKKYVVATIHRAENTDCKEKLNNIIDSLETIVKQQNLPVILPIHPRTLNKIKEFNIKISNLIITKPLGYLNFLSILANSAITITDSGGIQEEATILQVPCVTIRETTERPETVKVGANIIAGTKKSNIIDSVTRWLEKKKKKWKNPFGDGKASERILSIIKSNYMQRKT